MPQSVKDKFKYLLIDILDNPRNLNTIGNPEQLKHSEIEIWSRELTKKDRIVYGIETGATYKYAGRTGDNSILPIFRTLSR